MTKKRKKKLRREEDGDYRASSDGSPDPGITD
jgi:hypothetical protein